MVLKNQSVESWFLLQTSLERQQFRYDATISLHHLNVSIIFKSSFFISLSLSNSIWRHEIVVDWLVIC